MRKFKKLLQRDNLLFVIVLLMFGHNIYLGRRMTLCINNSGRAADYSQEAAKAAYKAARIAYEASENAYEASENAYEASENAKAAASWASEAYDSSFGRLCYRCP